MTTSPDARSIATLRSLAVDQVQAARSGHPGMPLGAAPILHVLFGRFLKADPAQPSWLDRDRFVLSAGHASALLYATLHLAGYDLGIDDLRAFRQWGSRTPGHPERGTTPGVEATTGPLGQGLANAVGMAIAESMLAARLNRPGGTLIDHRTWVLASDGDLMEGVALEAVALAGVLRLGKLTVLYDDNGVVIDGPAAGVHDAGGVCAAIAALGWDVSEPVDGTDVEAIAAAIERAIADEARPSLVRVRTRIGDGSAWAGTSRVHGGPLDPDDAARLKRALADDLAEPFAVPGDVRAWWAAVAERGGEARRRWEASLERVAPRVIAELDRLRAPEPLDDARLRSLAPALEAPEPGRFTGGRVLDAVAGMRPELVGGAADLVAATLTAIDGGGTYGPDDRAGRNIRFGVREHAMGAVANGIALHGLLRPFASTFLVFASYEANALRMAAMQGLPVIHVFTHDSITVGEDGPTHQPVEMLAMLRAMPGMEVLRPADGEEVITCWAMAVERLDGPTALVLSRMALAPLDRSRAVGDARRGGYRLRPAPGGREPDVVLVGSGSEVGLAVAAADRLAARGIAAAVVSMPSQGRFLAQDDAYRAAVLPPGVPRLVVEAGHPLSLWAVAGPLGAVHGLERFGASAPPPVVLEHLGMTPDAVADAAEALLARLAAAGTAASGARPAAAAPGAAEPPAVAGAAGG